MSMEKEGEHIYNAEQEKPEMPSEKFKFVPEVKRAEIKPGIVVFNVIGSKEQSTEVNYQQFGEHIAERLAEKIEMVNREGRKLIFDMATGNTPKSVWPALEKLAKEKNLDLSNVVVFGHEQAYGKNVVPGMHSDFDNYRIKEFFQRNNIKPEKAQIVEAGGKSTIKGNFMPMDVRGTPEETVEYYNQIFKQLKKVPNIEYYALYGVGTDGHIGESQINAQGFQSTLKQRNFYIDQVEEYSIEGGLYNWQDYKQKVGESKEKGMDFYPMENINNIFWSRDKEEEKVGRGARTDYESWEKIVGVGWRQMLEPKDMVLGFHKADRELVLNLIVEGTFDGTIQNEKGVILQEVKRDKGEGEKILPDLLEYCKELVRENLIQQEFVDKIEQKIQRQSPESNRLITGEIFQEIYKGLNEQKATADNPVYRKMWEFANRYIGKRAPIARLIRLRTLLGKNTELVLTPEAVSTLEFYQKSHQISK